MWEDNKYLFFQSLKIRFSLSLDLPSLSFKILMPISAGDKKTVPCESKVHVVIWKQGISLLLPFQKRLIFTTLMNLESVGLLNSPNSYGLKSIFHKPYSKSENISRTERSKRSWT
jgi:hypothetical protein